MIHHSWWCLTKNGGFFQALDLLTARFGAFSVADTSQSLYRMPVIFEGSSLMTLTFCPQWIYILIQLKQCFLQEARRQLPAHVPAAIPALSLGFGCTITQCINGHSGAECLLLMGVDLEELGYAGDFTNSDSGLQYAVIWSDQISCQLFFYCYVAVKRPQELRRLSGNAISMRCLYATIATILLALDPQKVQEYLSGP